MWKILCRGKWKGVSWGNNANARRTKTQVSEILILMQTDAKLSLWLNALLISSLFSSCVEPLLPLLLIWTEVEVPIAKPKRQRKLKQQPRVEDAQIDFEVKQIEETDDQDEEDDEDEECSAKRCLRPTSNIIRILLSLIFILFTMKLLELVKFFTWKYLRTTWIVCCNRWPVGMDPVRSVWEVVPLFVHRSSEGRRSRTRRLRVQRVSIASQRSVLSGRKGQRGFCVRRSSRAVGQLSISNGRICVERRRHGKRRRRRHQWLWIKFGRKGLKSGNAGDWRWRHHRGIAAMMFFIWTVARPFAFERMCRTVSELFSDVVVLFTRYVFSEKLDLVEFYHWSFQLFMLFMKLLAIENRKASALSEQSRCYLSLKIKAHIRLFWFYDMFFSICLWICFLGQIQLTFYEFTLRQPQHLLFVKWCCEFANYRTWLGSKEQRTSGEHCMDAAAMIVDV